MTGQGVARRQFLRAAGVTGAVIAPALLLRPTAAEAATAAPTVVRASSFGWNATDNTTALQNALDSGADFVVIDLVSGQSTTTWLTGPLFVNDDNFTIIVQAGVTVQSIAGFGTQDCLVSMTGRTGITILGYGAIFAMNKAEYTSGEFRHVLTVRSCDAVWIEGLTLRDSGGDGLDIVQDAGADRHLYPQYCSNITVKNVTCDNNRRNGMSVISVDGLTVQGCAFINTTGTAPQAGVDIEPASLTTFPDQRIKNVTFSDTRISGNNEGGIDISLGGLNGSTNPISIALKRIMLTENRTKAEILVNGAGTGDPGGVVTVTDSLANTFKNAGSLRVGYKAALGMGVQLVNTVFWEEPSVTSTFAPMTLSPAISTSTVTDPVPEYGGVTWTRATMITNQPPPFLAVEDDSLASEGVGRLDGDLTVVDPNGVSMNLGANPHDNTLVVTPLTAFPATTVNVTTNTTSIVPGGVALLTFTRTSSDTTASMGIMYSVTASPTAYIDGLPGGAVIPAGKTSVTVPLHSSAPWYLDWLGSANSGTVTVTISAADFQYTIGSNDSVTVTIS